MASFVSQLPLGLDLLSLPSWSLHDFWDPNSGPKSSTASTSTAKLCPQPVRSHCLSRGCEIKTT